MSKALDFNTARQREKSRAPHYYPASDPAKLNRFQRAYARYAKQEKAAGRKPLPPVQYLKSIRP